MKHLQDYVIHFPSMLKNTPLLSTLTGYFEDQPKQVMNESWRSCEAVPLGPSALCFTMVREFMRDMLEKYKMYADIKTLNHVTHIEHFNMFRYRAASKKDWFHEHADCWNDASATRQLSLIAYLNTVEAGGQTVFPNLGLEFHPFVGDVIMFPSNFLYHHYALAPESNDKLILVGWYHFGPKTGYTSYPL